MDRKMPQFLGPYRIEERLARYRSRKASSTGTSATSPRPHVLSPDLLGVTPKGRAKNRGGRRTAIGS